MQICVFARVKRYCSLSNAIYVGAIAVQTVDCLKYLGVLLDPTLDFSMQASAASCSVKRCLGAVHRACASGLSKHNLDYLYTRKLLPVLTYALPVVAPIRKKGWASLEKCHHFAARTVTNNYVQPYSDLLQSLSWKPIVRITCERSALLMYKYVHSMRHFPADDLAVALPNLRYDLRSRQHNLRLLLPQSYEIPLVRLYRIWNALPISSSLGSDVCSSDLPSLRRFVTDATVFTSVQNALPASLPILSDL